MAYEYYDSLGHYCWPHL